jgi:flavin reductase (DIM6/NTAB) family NADH-FMN oxidoreductase RutF
MRAEESQNKFERVELPQPGAMIFPVPAVVLGVAGDDIVQDDLTVVWSFVLDGQPPQVGISVGLKSAINNELQVCLDLLRKHGNFTLNVPDTTWVNSFDQIDMCASERADKFSKVGITRLPSKLISAPGIAEAAIVLECKVISFHELPPNRTVFFADVLRTSVHPGVTEIDGTLIPTSREFFGMAAGCGEFWTLGKRAGHIGQTKGIDHIRY